MSNSERLFVDAMVAISVILFYAIALHTLQQPQACRLVW